MKYHGAIRGQANAVGLQVRGYAIRSGQAVPELRGAFSTPYLRA